MISAGKLEGEIIRRLQRELDKEDVLSRVPKLRQVIESYLRRPAKLLRPRILLASANAYAKGNRGAPREALLRLATATELLHVFALLHDDRVDASPREGVRLPATPGKEAFMLLAGDLLHTVAVQMIQESVTAFSLSRAIPRRVHSVSVRTIAGQTLEVSQFDEPGRLPTLDSLYEVYDLKTGYYSFVAPLVVGALATGYDSAEGDAPRLEKIGLLLGRAFQLRDDAEDIDRLISDPPEGHLPPWELALLLVYLAHQGRRQEAAIFLEPQSRRGSILKAMRDVELREWSQLRINSLLEDAEAAFEELSPRESQRGALLEAVLQTAELTRGKP